MPRIEGSIWRPVEAGGFEELVDVGAVEGQGGVVVEEAAVEPVDRREADAAAVLHRGEERGGVGGEVGRGGARGFQHLLEELVGQEADVLGEHAEDQAVDEVGDGLRRVAALAQAQREGGELRRRPRRSARRGSCCGFSRSGSVKAALEEVALRAVEEVVEREGVGLLDGVGEVGADDDAVHVARR